jgi:hypothetical protein
MEIIKDFKLTDIDSHEIVFVVTSIPDYEMSRVIIAEHFNKHWGNYYVIKGYHCSCYDFSDPTMDWECTEYTKDELNTVLTGWLTTGDDEEKLIAKVWFETQTDKY